MTSTITLYKDSKIIPSRNFVVEGIETYLAGLTKSTITDYQYLRNDLTLTIKINKAQIFTESSNTYNYNYLKVLQNGFTYYYFIVKKTQISQSTIAYELVMDTLNTYPWNTAFTPSNRTRVRREHKDRLTFKLLGFEFRDNSLFNPLITLTSGNTYTGKLILKVNGNNKEYNADFYYSFILPARYFFRFKLLDSEDQIELYKLRDSSNVQFISFYDEDNPDGIIEANGDLFFNSEYKTNSISQKRIIDYYSEGFTPVLYKKELGLLTHNENADWNLVYRNDDDQAIACYCIPSDSGLNFDSATAGTLTYENFEDGVYYNFCPFVIDGVEQSLILKDQDGKEYPVRASHSNGITTWKIKQVLRTGTTLKIRTIISNYLNNKLVFGPSQEIYSWKTITSLSFDASEAYYRTTAASPTGLNPVAINPSNGQFSNTSSPEPIQSLQDINRADPKLIKIIEIPYFPSAYSYTEGSNLITTDTTWVYSSGDYTALRLNDLNTKFSSTIVSNVDNPLYIFEIIESINPSEADLRNDFYESKLFHSDYYQPKFIYDSFGFVFRPELIDEEKANISSTFTFEFIMTSTINSKFMFRFPEYVLKMSREDFDNILPVARNNEAPIYTSAYITYLTSAYRYDLKSLLSRQTLIGGAMLGGMGAGVAQIVGGAVSENYGQIAQGFFTALGSEIGGITSLLQQERNFEKNIETLKNQANSVSGSDDIDLLNAYCDNRAKLCLYEVSPRMKKLISSLFYYYGYTTDEIKIPEVNTRYWFNFLSCELEYTGIDKNISDLCKEDLIAKYNAGATFLHNHSGVWDFAQEKENWETSIL